MLSPPELTVDLGLQRTTLTDFTGGLCDTGRRPFHLPENQTADICNVDVTGTGFCVRHGIQRVNVLGLGGTPCVSFVVDGRMFVSTTGGLVEVDCDTGVVSTRLTSPTTVECCWRAICPQDTVIYHNGVDQSWPESGPQYAPAGSATWNNDYASPVGGVMPAAKYMATYQGLLFAADIQENGQRLCNRIRWSHPLLFDSLGTSQGFVGAGDWHEEDWKDIGKAGECITGMVVCGGALWIFKENSTHVLTGNPTLGTAVCSEVDSKRGAPSCDAIVCCDGRLFTFDVNSGVSAGSTEGSTNLSAKIQPLLDCLTPEQRDGAHLGVCGNKLFLGIPGFGTLVSSTSGGPWTKYDYVATQPHVKNGRCFATVDGNLMELDVKDQFFDNFGAGPEPIDARYRTSWVSLGDPFAENDVCEVRVSAYGSASGAIAYFGGYDPTEALGSDIIELPDDEDPDAFTLGESKFPEAGQCRLYPGGPLVELPGPKPEGTPRFKGESGGPKVTECVTAPRCRTNAVQMLFQFKDVVEWCVCAIAIVYSTEPFRKE